MTDWWSYRLSDFLLFSPRTYWRLFELHNETLWPLPLVTLGLGLVGLALALVRPRHHGRAIAMLLAILWAFVGWSFLWQRYATINWAATYIAPLFALQALLLVIIGCVLDRLALEQRGLPRTAALILIAAALSYPLLTALFDRPWQSAEYFGTAPDPTVIATLGFLLLARSRSAALLYPIPLLWCLASAVTLWAMDDAQALVPLAATVLAAIGVIIQLFETARYRSLPSRQ